MKRARRVQPMLLSSPKLPAASSSAPQPQPQFEIPENDNEIELVTQQYDGQDSVWSEDDETADR